MAKYKPQRKIVNEDGSVSVEDITIDAGTSVYVDGKKQKHVVVDMDIQTQLDETNTKVDSNLEFTKAELDKKVSTNTANKAEGYVKLGADGVIPSELIPGTVDDVLEGTYVDETTFNDPKGKPYKLTTGKIYFDTVTGMTYRWGGTSLAEMSSGKDKRVDEILDNTIKLQNSRGGFAAGSAKGDPTGVAIGPNANAGYGAALGVRATTINGAAVGQGSESRFGGAVGDNTWTQDGGAVGRYAQSVDEGGAIGYYTKTSGGGSVGREAKSTYGFSGGYKAQSEVNSIQLGEGVNNSPKSLQVYNHKIMDENGHLITGSIVDTNGVEATPGEKVASEPFVKKHIYDLKFNQIYNYSNLHANYHYSTYGDDTNYTITNYDNGTLKFKGHNYYSGNKSLGNIKLELGKKYFINLGFNNLIETAPQQMLLHFEQKTRLDITSPLITSFVSENPDSTATEGWVYIYFYYDAKVDYEFTITPNIIDLTEMYGEGNEPSTLEELQKDIDTSILYNYVEASPSTKLLDLIKNKDVLRFDSNGDFSLGEKATRDKLGIDEHNHRGIAIGYGNTLRGADNILIGVYSRSGGVGGRGIAIGHNVAVGDNDVIIGNTTGRDWWGSYNGSCVGVGYGVRIGNDSNVAIGAYANAGNDPEEHTSDRVKSDVIAIGYSARGLNHHTIQIGSGTNRGRDTLQINNHRVMDKDGNLYVRSIVDGQGVETTKGFKVLDESQLGVANGVATLDENGFLTGNQIPGTIDEVYEGTYREADGEFIKPKAAPEDPDVLYDKRKDKIYFDTSTGIQYRWSGTAFATLVDGKDPRVDDILDNTTKIADKFGGFSAGEGSASYNGGASIGSHSVSYSGGAVGNYAKAVGGFSGGDGAVGTQDAIQLGRGTNTEEKSLQVYDHKVMNADGTLNSGGKKVLVEGDAVADARVDKILDNSNVIMGSGSGSDYSLRIGTNDDYRKGIIIGKGNYSADGTNILLGSDNSTNISQSGAGYDNIFIGSNTRCDGSHNAFIGGTKVKVGHSSYNNTLGKATYINGDYNIALGYMSKVGSEQAKVNNSIQLGKGTNNTSDTMQVWDHKLMDKADGQVYSKGNKVLDVSMLSEEDITKLKALLSKLSVDDSGNLVSSVQIDAPAFNDTDAAQPV